MVFKDEPKTYEEKRKFRYGLQDYMHAVFEFASAHEKDVLEIGVGSGIDSAEFLRNGARVVSVDFSHLAAKSAKLLFREANLNGQIMLTDARYLPFRESQFDVVYSFGVIHHISDIMAVLREVSRVLRRRGMFIGMVYNKDSLLYAYSILYLHGFKEGLLSKGVSEQELASNFSERFTGNLYTRPYTREDITDLLQDFFDSVWVGTYYNVIDTPQRRKVKFHFENDSNDFGWHLAFKALKK